MPASDAAWKHARGALPHPLDFGLRGRDRPEAGDAGAFDEQADYRRAAPGFAPCSSRDRHRVVDTTFRRCVRQVDRDHRIREMLSVVSATPDFMRCLSLPQGLTQPVQRRFADAPNAESRAPDTAPISRPSPPRSRGVRAQPRRGRGYPSVSDEFELSLDRIARNRHARQLPGDDISSRSSTGPAPSGENRFFNSSRSASRPRAHFRSRRIPAAVGPSIRPAASGLRPRAEDAARRRSAAPAPSRNTAPFPPSPLKSVGTENLCGIPGLIGQLLSL